MSVGLGEDVALITDGRFSCGSHGFLIGHIVPEAQEGGPIGLVRDGDEIVIDAETRKLDLMVGEGELERRKEWVKPELKYRKGTLAKYARMLVMGVLLTWRWKCINWYVKMRNPKVRSMHKRQRHSTPVDSFEVQFYLSGKKWYAI
jgi:hypothetical protein